MGCSPDPSGYEFEPLGRLDYVELGFKPISRDRTTWRSAGIRGACCPFVAQQITPDHRILEWPRLVGKSPIPQPGNFDAELDRPKVDMHEGHRRKAVDPGHRRGRRRKRLERIAIWRGEQPGEVVSESAQP